jgi:RNA polymerase sigma factor (sigma-70 family)
MTDPPAAPPHSAPSDIEDLAIIAEIRGGQLARFDILVNRYKTPLLRYLLHHVRQFDVAEDLAQETFLKLFRSPPPLHSARLGTWLFTLARNAAIDHLRATKRRSLNHNHLHLAPRDTSMDPITAAALQEEHARLVARLSTLPPEQQEVLTLRLLAELPLDQIAQITQAPLPTVKSRLRYALSRFSQTLPQEARS